MADELHASLTPNVVDTGGTLKVVFDSSAKEWKDADSVVVTVFEIDDASPFEPKPGKGKILVTFEGTLADNVFTLRPSPKGGPANPKLPKVSGSPPIVKIQVDGTVADVALPDKDQEQGIFELRLQVEIKKPKVKKFTSATKVMVRSFDHFKVKETSRPVVAFITGGRDDNYFKTATEFWKLNADVVVAKQGMSLQQVLAMLEKEHDKFGDWGQINIVAHGRERYLKIKLFNDSTDGLHTDKIATEIDRHTAKLPSPDGIDKDTQIVMRACNAGRDAPLIKALHSNVFGGNGTLLVPKFVQVYQFSQQAGGKTTANEWFEESLTFDTPATTAPSGKALQDGLEKAWDTLVSPGKGGVKADEVATFSAKHDWVQMLPVKIEAELEGSMTKPDGAPMSNADLSAKLRSDWKSRHKLDTKSESWNTEADRWVITVKSKSPTKNQDAKNGWSLRVKKGTATPMFQHHMGGSVSVGGKEATNVWLVEADDVSERHFDVELGPNANQIKVTDSKSGEPTFVGSKPLVDGASAVFTLPVTIRFGKAELEVRIGKKPVDLVFECKRFHVDRRRTLRTFDTTKSHKDRSMVIPTVTNPEHYGTSAPPAETPTS